jgi:thioredoxin 1
MVQEINENNFDDEVLKAELPTVVDFWAPWCGPCQLISPLIEKFEELYEGKIKFCKINVDENQQLAANAGVESIPLLVFYKNGERVDQSVGLVPPSEIKPKIEALL